MSMQYFSVPTEDSDGDGDQAVMVPSITRKLVPNPPERLWRLRKHLVQSLRALRTMKDPEGNASPLRSAPEGFAAKVARTACTMCRGFCCKGGGEHAYLDERVMARVRIAQPELDAREVVRLYLESVPAVGYEGTCLFHGEKGCTLDRSLRSDVCNSYFCDMLGEFVKKADKATSVIVMAGEGEFSRMSPILRPDRT
jgi:hypothetical protein